MNSDYDVVVVGAGPVGSTIAFYLSKKDLSVCLIDKKRQIGYPLQCAGILSNHIFDLNELPENLILNKVKGAFLHTNNHVLNVEKDYDVAYIIDRIAYDEYLFNRALESGVEFINQKAIDYDLDEGIVFLQNDTQIKSKVIVGCEGYNSVLSNQMGNTQSNFNASQMLVEISKDDISKFRNAKGNNEIYVDTYLREDILPGFLWIIPIGEDLYRIGLFSNESHKKQDLILNDFLNDNFKFVIKEKYKGFIPIFNEKNKLICKRGILIGDAAGQVKPTSGGGLLIAFDACKIASENIFKSIQKDDLNYLKEYQEEFLEKYLKEFKYQFKVHKTLNMLSNDDLDYLFIKLKENDCEELISNYGDMDNQSVLIKEFIKRGLIFKIIPKFLFKKVTNIFGF
ncbi:MAG: NAD(P)/FAD-dependent oxidoreductase [Methanobrevibacter sp.]|nr:NAD(P)/FAD-dependent oxidoreductase [Methanobrevibacter sp.]